MKADDLSKSKIRAFAKMLECGKTVEFIFNELYYEIFESANSGYIVNVYSNDERDKDGYYLDKHIVDGGLCTGSAENAIVFML